MAVAKDNLTTSSEQVDYSVGEDVVHLASPLLMVKDLF